MHIYFCGIGGAGLAPLAMLCRDIGWTVSGSDTAESLNTTELKTRDIDFELDQSGNYLQKTHHDYPVDWFVYSSAVTDQNQEYLAAKKMGLTMTKRDELLNCILKEKNLKLLAVAGTHGKTTTTAMLVWLFQKIGVPVSYLIGSNISFGAAASYQEGSRYFVYECDEFDRNFLSFSPEFALVPSLDYDHPDTYPTKEIYRTAFHQFFAQCDAVIGWQVDLLTVAKDLPQMLLYNSASGGEPGLTLFGAHNRQNMSLVLWMLERLMLTDAEFGVQKSIVELLPFANIFPGTQRRQEKIATNVYSDYAHHPVEIAATLAAFAEEFDRICVVYQPHQNIRQHAIMGEYAHCFDAAYAVYWLPTYLSREDPKLEILSQQTLANAVKSDVQIHLAALDANLKQQLIHEKSTGSVLVFLGAGSIDAWAREHFIN